MSRTDRVLAAIAVTGAVYGATRAALYAAEGSAWSLAYVALAIFWAYLAICQFTRNTP